MIVKESQAVPRVGQAVQDPGDDPWEEGQQVQLCVGVPVEFEKYVKRLAKSEISAVGMVKLEESSKLVVHTEKPFAEEFLAVEKSAVKKRRQDQAKRSHKEENCKLVRGEGSHEWRRKKPQM